MGICIPDPSLPDTRWTETLATRPFDKDLCLTCSKSHGPLAHHLPILTSVALCSRPERCSLRLDTYRRLQGTIMGLTFSRPIRGRLGPM